MSKDIVMIHGMWGGEWCWDNYRVFFEKIGYRCITPVLLHHEETFKDKPHPSLGTTSILDYVDDLEQQIRSLNEIPILMGHSMGGLIAQILAGRGLAQSLILLTPASPYGITTLKWSIIKSFWSKFTWNFWKRSHRPTFDEAVYSVLYKLKKKNQKEIFDKYVYESGKVLFEIGFWFLDFNRATKVDESQIRCPVLVVSGAEDRITPPPVVKKIAKKYKTVATYKSFSNHGHWVLGEPGWEKIAEYVADWLAAIQ